MKCKNKKNTYKFKLLALILTSNILTNAKTLKPSMMPPTMMQRNFNNKKQFKQFDSIKRKEVLEKWNNFRESKNKLYLNSNKQSSFPKYTNMNIPHQSTLKLNDGYKNSPSYFFNSLENEEIDEIRLIQPNDGLDDEEIEEIRFFIDPQFDVNSNNKICITKIKNLKPSNLNLANFNNNKEETTTESSNDDLNNNYKENYNLFLDDSYDNAFYKNLNHYNINFNKTKSSKKMSNKLVNLTYKNESLFNSKLLNNKIQSASNKKIAPIKPTETEIPFLFEDFRKMSIPNIIRKLNMKNLDTLKNLRNQKLKK